MTDPHTIAETRSGSNFNIGNDLNIRSQLQKNTTNISFTSTAVSSSNANTMKVGTKRRANTLISTSKVAGSSSGVNSITQVNLIAIYWHMCEYY